ncbi:MAG: VOC family protein [bacterium]|nr:VOC family protein [bacterium]
MKPSFIDHIVLIVKDLKETEKFYTTFLSSPSHLDEEYMAYKIGESTIYLALSDGEFQKVDKDKGSLNHLAFGVRTAEELREFEKVLNEADIKNSGVKIDKYGNKEFIWFDDPNGYRLEFYSRP